MATSRTEVAGFDVDQRVWPEPLPRVPDLILHYGVDADELVVLFRGKSQDTAIVEFIATPDDDYAAIKVNAYTGEVVGVLVYPLEALAIKRHPHWSRVLEPNPSPATAEHIVTDIRALFDRFGLIQDSAA